ncbi:MAG: ribosome maturation factor RimM [Propionicimonas sp.]
MSEQVIVGTVGRAHGLRGQVTVRPRTDSVAERFAAGARVTAGGRSLTVSGHTLSSGRLVVGFAEVPDRGAADALRGLDLWADGAQGVTEADEFHDGELIGLAAFDPDGRHRGEVVAVQHNPAQDLLVVRTPDGDRLVPFVAQLVPEVDPDAGRLVINPIPGLLAEVSDAD